MRSLKLFLVVTMLVAAVANAQVAKAPTKDDAVPLKNWPVMFDRTAPVAVAGQSGKFVPSVNAVPSGTSTFFAIVPCRLVDTRTNGQGPFTAGTLRTYDIDALYAAQCSGTIPAAAAYTLNFTVVNYTGRAAIVAYPHGAAQPTGSILNLGASGGNPIGNGAIVGADPSGQIDVLLTSTPTPGQSHLVIDINGYFNENATSANVANTLVLRDANGDFQAGTITATKVLGAVYQDLAEWVPAASDLRPGTVVTLDPADGRRVVPSSHAYDTTVAGVVSENPGIVLGKGGPEKSQIATTGRVRIMVDATAAPIHVGDLLVTSNVQGVAMRSNPVTVDGQSMHRPGTIIGKAMEPLASGRGEIMVLLSLQ